MSWAKDGTVLDIDKDPRYTGRQLIARTFTRSLVDALVLQITVVWKGEKERKCGIGKRKRRKKDRGKEKITKLKLKVGERIKKRKL